MCEWKTGDFGGKNVLLIIPGDLVRRSLTGKFKVLEGIRLTGKLAVLERESWTVKLAVLKRKSLTVKLVVLF